MKKPTARVAQRPQRWLRRLAAIAAGGLAMFALGVLAANVGIRRVTRPFIHTLPTSPTSRASHAPQGPRVDLIAAVAIVPGASVRRDGTPSPQLEERLATALTLIRGGQVQRVLVSGARNGAYDEAGPMRHWLTQQGVRAARVLEDHAGFRTLDTMQRAARVYGVRDAIVCTQAFHLPRAVFLARRAGIDAEGLAAGGDGAGHSTSDAVREALASLVAVIDSYVLHRQPRDSRVSPAPSRPPAAARSAGSSNPDSK
ncbi:MAG: ElyC/SanA/YdcF family protein [Pseudomonadota bacterium]